MFTFIVVRATGTGWVILLMIVTVATKMRFTKSILKMRSVLNVDSEQINANAYEPVTLSILRIG